MSVELRSAGPRRSIPLARTMIERAEQEAERGRWKSARASYTAAIAADPTPASLVACGIALAERDQFPEAVALLERAWNRSCHLADADLRAVCCRNLAIIHGRQGNRALERQFAQLALAAHMQSQRFECDATISSIDLVQAAARCSDEDDHVAALQQLHAARVAALADRDVDPAVIESGLGAVLARLGMLRLAVGCLFRSARLHLQSGNRVERAHDLSNLGHLLQGLGRLADAGWCFRLAAGLLEQSGAVLSARGAREFEREAQYRLALESCDPERN